MYLSTSIYQANKSATAQVAMRDSVSIDGGLGRKIRPGLEPKQTRNCWRRVSTSVPEMASTSPHLFPKL